MTHRAALRRLSVRLALIAAGLLAVVLGVTVAGSPASSSPAPSCGGETVLKPSGAAWTCTFDDEFSGSTLSAAWTPQQTSNSGYVTGDPAAGVACYVNNRDTVAVSGGHLNLTVRKAKWPQPCVDPSGNFSTLYTAGMVSTWGGRFSQTYGRFEVRAKLPSTSVPGLQETLWLWPDNQTYGAWPASGEIDFAEFYSQYATLAVPKVHYVYDPSTVNTATNTNTTTAYCGIKVGQFNTYALEWSPTRLTMSVNGTTCLVDNVQATGLPAGAPFDQPFFVLLTSALGLGSNAVTAKTPFPATTQIDYVRVWS